MLNEILDQFKKAVTSKQNFRRNIVNSQYFAHDCRTQLLLKSENIKPDD